MSTIDLIKHVHLIRIYYWMLLSICIMAFAACQSNDRMYRPNSKDPFAENAPKTKEEEAYYHDVHSGEWKEQTNPFGFAKSIGKKNGSTEMPPHWAMIPPGAKSMSELKAEKRAREQGQAAVAMNYSPVYSAPVQGNIPGFLPAPGSYPPSAYQNGPIPMNGYAPQMVPTSAPMQMNNAVPQGNPQYSPMMPSVQQNPQPIPNSQFSPQPVPPGTYYPPAMNPQQIPSSNQAPAPINPQGNQVQGNQAQNNGPPIPIPGMENSSRSPGSSDSVVGTCSDQKESLKVKELYPTIKAPDAILGQGINRVFRGQMPIDRSLRSRMRSAYFQDEPLRLAWVQAPAPDPANVAAIQPDQKEKSPEKKLEPDPNLRIGGSVLPLKIDPQLADRWKNADPLPPLQIPSPAPYNRSGTLPSAEYIVDGGDKEGSAYSDTNWNVHHLDVEDTIAHFDTIDGQILVEPSNEVKIYSPRFGSVRQILLPTESESRIVLADTRTDLKPYQGKDVLGIDIRSQDEAVNLTRGNTDLVAVNTKLSLERYKNDEFVAEQIQLEKLGDLMVKMKTGLLTKEDQALLAAGSSAASVWGELQRVEVDIDSYRAQVNVWDIAPEALFVIDTGTKSSKLKLVKIASKSAAQPGELVEFILRFENVGNQPIGNITILDNLSPRLEYVSNSARSSLKGEFLAEKNTVGSQILRWEITDPLPKGGFGVIQFVCRVR